MSEGKIAGCDPEDILCHIRVIGLLKGLQEVLGEESYRQKFPEFEGIDTKLTKRIKEEDTGLEEAILKCELPGPDAPETILEEVQNASETE